jgi:flagellar protein FliO/FliZ
LPVPTFLLAAARGESTPLNLPADAPRHLASAGGGSSTLVRPIVGLAVVIAVIYGVAWVLRQVKSAREERSAGTGLSSAATIALGPNRSLHLVRAGRELVLVGVAEHGVTPIRTYTEEEARAVGLLSDDEDVNGGSGPDSAPGGLPAGARPAGTSALVDRLRRLTVRS